MGIKAIVEEDKRYLRFKHLYQSEEIFSIPIKKRSTEVDGLHAIRKVRTLSIKDPQIVTKLIEACIQDTGYRSRCTEIKMQVAEASTSLKHTIDSLIDYLIARYQGEFDAGVRAKEARVKTLRSLPLFREALDYLNELDSLWERIDMVIEDIDKAAWSLKLIVETIQIDRKPESKL